ncbi:hypothetical protein EST38_g10474 [Candolleomyces aberdarensis]|uniref:Dienelactone hydrolase domain-containing protein n=1 Tax=Candolleomyces aberdarensis TaxID=2316362 RepID=A0A4Q2D9H7_9AGAR|nr:hypothetical protein EST38_g10474 [Candolleomyces aberdarensis]
MWSLKLPVLLTLLSAPLLALSALDPSSPVLAGPITEHCIEGAKHAGEPVGTNVTIADVPTYLSEPTTPPSDEKKKVLLFFSDIYSPFYVNNQLLQDYFASEGFNVVGIDYFFGDPIQAHDGQPGFNMTAWFNKSREQAERALPGWIEAVRTKYGADAKYAAVGYCFGAPYALEISATDKVVAGAFAHPSGLVEAHFSNLTKPLLLSCAETDSSFPTASLRRAVDILAGRKATYHLQVFSGVSHGFATRADPNDANAVWAKEESARSVVGWFNRFSK